MERRDFLKSSLLAAGFVALSPLISLTEGVNADQIEFFYYEGISAYSGFYESSMKAIFKGVEYSTTPLRLPPTIDGKEKTKSIHKAELIRFIKQQWKLK